MADADPHAPWHEPAMPVVEEDTGGCTRPPNGSRTLSGEEILAWAWNASTEWRSARPAASTAWCLIDMAWRLNPDIRVFTLETGRLPPETYALFEEIRERYGIAVEFEYPEPPRWPPW